jgi:Mg/Co/Ni transporter MgtE
MSHVQELSHAFIASHPDDAARVLEQLPPEASAALFGEAPARVLAPTVRAMMPFMAAQAMVRLPTQAGAHLMNECGAGHAAAIMRYVPESRRAALIEELPTATAVSLRLLLGFPASSVGAWIDTALPALPAGTSANDALERLRTAEEEEVDVVHVVDAAQRLLGLVEIGALIRAGGNVLLTHLMRPARQVLPVNASLASIEHHSGWDARLTLPAVERDGRLVGVLRRATLMRALAHTRRGSRTTDDGSRMTFTEALGAGYWTTVDGLMQSAIALLPEGRPLKAGVKPGKSHD